MKQYARDFTTREKPVIVKDWYENNVRCVIKSLGSHFTAYIGVSEGHPLAGFGYDKIPLDCHGGLTYAREGTEKYLPKGYWWYGWDYAHAGDRFFDKHVDLIDVNDHDWTLKELENEVWSVSYNFKKLIDLSEEIFKKDKWIVKK